MPSRCPLAKIFPSGEKVSASTAFGYVTVLCLSREIWSLRIRLSMYMVWRSSCSPVSVSQRISAPFQSSPLTTVFPSGDTAIAAIPPKCPAKMAVCSPVSISHNRTVPSKLPLARKRPSAGNPNEVTLPVCPMSRASSSPVWASYIQMPISVATAMRLPSGVYLMSCKLPFPSRNLALSGSCH